jgi:hypothetical protein
VAWPQLEPTENQWDFTRLDKFEQLASEKGVRILLVLGLSPPWASSRPSEPSAYYPGYAAPPARLEAWRKYVHIVANRFNGRIHEYEIWNEPNFPAFYTGTVDQLVQLTRIAAEEIKSVDPAATLVSPAVSGPDGLRWLERFLQAGGGRYVDVVGYHFYVFPKPPEQMLPLILQVRKLIDRYAPGKPLWNTESGWGRGRGEVPKQITDVAPAYVARAYILNWLGGAQRFYWYAWDNQNWVTLRMTDDQSRPEPAAKAFDQVRMWLTGKHLGWCSVDATGMWRCGLRMDSRSGWLAWHPLGSAMLRLRPDTVVHSLDGTVERSISSVSIGPEPKLVLSESQ